MARTDSDLVEELLSYNYDGTTSLSPYITAANLIVNRLAALAADKGISAPSDDLAVVETWLAAYRYCTTDPLYVSKGTDKASGSWSPRSYLDGAIESDPTGLLKALLEQRRAGGVWLGKTELEQQTYDQRMG